MIIIHITGFKTGLRLLPSWGHPTDLAMSQAGQVARALLRYAATATEKFPDAVNWVFSRSPSGQPQVENAESRSIWISFSHSGDWIGCGLSTRGPIGIDIETHKSDRNLVEIAKLGFGPGEQQRSQNGIDEFYRIWTSREAIAKATGIGMVQVTDGRDYAAAGPMSGGWRIETPNQVWNLTHALPVAGLSFACATSADETAVPEPPVVFQLFT
ncbi:4'-phosphopantetheinyl transferase superfamily protein [Ferrovibrio terrae]|uniref:4'-phosphopantetheinyl transferase family protein n=1 Tax=Ferrovibrio terrae TaxID=2594003 RepID=UPI0031378500